MHTAQKFWPTKMYWTKSGHTSHNMAPFLPFLFHLHVWYHAASWSTRHDQQHIVHFGYKVDATKSCSKKNVSFKPIYAKCISKLLFHSLLYPLAQHMDKVSSQTSQSPQNNTWNEIRHGVSPPKGSNLHFVPGLTPHLPTSLTILSL